MAESSPLKKADILFISDGLTQFSGVTGAGCLPQWWSEEDLLLIALREQIRSVHGRKEGTLVDIHARVSFEQSRPGDAPKREIAQSSKIPDSQLRGRLYPVWLETDCICPCAAQVANIWVTPFTTREPTVLFDMADKNSGVNEASQHDRFVREVSS
jgi:hypothetical protein